MNIPQKKLTRWIKLLATYFLGQGATQVLQLVTGFMVINFLTKDAYATFTLVLAFQATTNVLVELGITRSLIPLIGKEVADKKVVGRYLSACGFLRNWTLLLGAIGLFVTFYLSASKYSWSFGYWLALWASVVLALVGYTVGSLYSSVFLLNQDIKQFYKIGLISGGARFFLILMGHAFGILTAPLVLTFGAIQALIGGFGKKLLTRDAVEHPPKGQDLSMERKEILELSLPRAPSVAFFAFEGQFTIFLMGILGTTAGLGELGALGRIGMLFMIVNKMGTVLINPHFAKRDVKQVLPHTVGAVFASTAFGLIVTGLVYMFPGLLLSLLGEGYEHLRYEIVLVVCASALRFIDIVAFSVCLARKYIYTWFSVADILPLVITMACGLAFFDLSTVRNMLYFGLAIAVVKLVTKFFILWIGIGRELKEVASVEPG